MYAHFDLLCNFLIDPALIVNSSPFHSLTMVIQTVGIVGTGVIGASWAALFLSRGLRVLVADPGPDAKTKFVAHVKSVWPSLEKIGVAKDATMDKYEFVGPSLLERINEVDFIQEVHNHLGTHQGVLLTPSSLSRTLRNDQT